MTRCCVTVKVLECELMTLLCDSQSVGEGSHHPGEEGEVREAGEGSATEDQPSLLHQALLHVPGQESTLYPFSLTQSR